MALPRGLTVLVTGATGGIGRELVTSLAKTGSRLILHGRSEDRVTDRVRAVAGRGVEARGIVADLSSLGETARLAEEALAAGPIDVLVNNAGVGFGKDRA